MKQNSLQQPTRQDDALLRNALLKLTATHKIICAVVIAAVAMVWWDLLNRLVTFGDRVDYSGLHVLGPQAVEFLRIYNPFFWWGIVALCTLIIAYFLYSFVQSTQRRVNGKLVSAETLAPLVSQLSAPAVEVLRWVWYERRNPITVGDLQRTAHELRASRAGKITLAREHAAILAQPGALSNVPKDLQS